MEQSSHSHCDDGMSSPSMSHYDPQFIPQHISVTHGDTLGNLGSGRYWILPGSRDRAKNIAETYLQDIEVRESKRGHDSYTGTFKCDEFPDGIDVGVISTGMGAPSVDIIVTELIRVGARVLIRVGTAGSLQKWVHHGDLVVASAAVRDEGTTRNYLPLEFPAIADSQLMIALTGAACQMNPAHKHWAGVVHTKDSLMAREFGMGPFGKEHERYMSVLSELGCLCSEMECAMLFALGQLYHGVRVGAVLAIIGDAESHDPFCKDQDSNKVVVEHCIKVAMMSLKRLRESMHLPNPTLPSLKGMRTGSLSTF